MIAVNGASAPRRKSGVMICHDMRMANLFDPGGPRKIKDFAGQSESGRLTAYFGAPRGFCRAPEVRRPDLPGHEPGKSI